MTEIATAFVGATLVASLVLIAETVARVRRRPVVGDVRIPPNHKFRKEKPECSNRRRKN